MKRSNRLMLVAGVVLAAVSFIAVLAFGGGGQQTQEPPQIPDVAVVVAATDLALGAELTAGSMTTITRPEPDAVGTYQNPDELVGRVVRRPVTMGQALTGDDFQTDTNAPDVVSALRPGLRAIAVPLSRLDSVAALVQPGDFVDVILALEELDQLNPVVIPNPAANTFDGGGEAPYLPLDEFVNNTSIKVVVQNVQVLATIDASPVMANDGSTETSPSDEILVVLAVTPQQVEVVRFAQLDGNISLVLRAPGDSTTGDVTTSGITLKELVDRWGVLPPRPVTP